MEAGKKPEGLDPRSKKDFVADFDFEFDEKHKTVSVTERGVAKAEKFLRHRPPLPRRERPPRQPPPAGAEGRVALQARRRLRGDRRRGPHHRRVHGPHPRGPALVGGPAPGRRGQGGRARPGGEPDARDHHAAELLPPLRQARGHDRHRPHRGDRVHEDLQARRRAGPDQPPDGPRRPQRSGLQDQGRQVARRGLPRSRSATRTASRSSSARSRSRSPSCSASSCKRKGIPHTVLNAKPEHAEREGEIVAEAGQPGAVTIATNMAGRGVDIKLGGNAEHLTELELAKLGLRPGDPDYDERFAEILPKIEERVEEDREKVIGGRRPVHRRHRAPRVAAHRQPAPRPLRPPGRPGRVALLPLRRGRPRAPVRRRPDLQDPRPPRHAPTRRATRSPSRRGCSPSRSRRPSARSRSRTSSSASACSSTTTS